MCYRYEGVTSKGTRGKEGRKEARTVLYGAHGLASCAWHRAGHFGFIPGHPSKFNEVGIVVVSILEMKKLRSQEIKTFAQKRRSWWSSGKESAFQCRGRKFDPWWGNLRSHMPQGN